jgi:hypothetical protein
MAIGPELITPEMEEMLNKSPGAISWISDVADPRGQLYREEGLHPTSRLEHETRPRGEPVDRSDVIDRASKLFDMGQLVLHEAIHSLKNQLRCECQHTAAAQAKIEELEEHMRDMAREANLSDRQD